MLPNNFNGEEQCPNNWPTHLPRPYSRHSFLAYRPIFASILAIHQCPSPCYPFVPHPLPQTFSPSLQRILRPGNGQTLLLLHSVLVVACYLSHTRVAAPSYRSVVRLSIATCSCTVEKWGHISCLTYTFRR